MLSPISKWPPFAVKMPKLRSLIGIHPCQEVQNTMPEEPKCHSISHKPTNHVVEPNDDCSCSSTSHTTQEVEERLSNTNLPRLGRKNVRHLCICTTWTTWNSHKGTSRSIPIAPSDIWQLTAVLTPMQCKENQRSHILESIEIMIQRCLSSLAGSFTYDTLIDIAQSLMRPFATIEALAQLSLSRSIKISQFPGALDMSSNRPKTCSK